MLKLELHSQKSHHPSDGLAMAGASFAAGQGQCGV